MFELDQRLHEDCFEVCRVPLSRVLLMNDATYPWFVLVPQREGITEIHALTDEDQLQMIRESSYLSRTLAVIFKADKMNVASLGNVVSQLHIHHIVRYKNDPAWPGPVWGRRPAIPYDENEKDRRIGRVRSILYDDIESPAIRLARD